MKLQMKNIGVRKSFIIAVACSGVFLNLAYSVDLFRKFFYLQYNTSVREVMISAIILEIGWAMLLVWVILKPFEKRHILLFTAVPILLGNMLHSLNQFGTHFDNFNAIAVNTIFGVLYSGLYVVAFMAGKNAQEEKKNFRFFGLIDKQTD
jgi:hypothetical protein